MFIRALLFPIAFFASLVDLLIDYVEYRVTRSGIYGAGAGLARDRSGMSTGMILLSGLFPLLFYFLLPRLF